MVKIFLLLILFTNYAYSQSKFDINPLEMLEITQDLIETYRTETRTPSQVLVRDKKTLDVLNIYMVSRNTLAQMDDLRDGISLIFKKLPNINRYAIDPKRLFPYIALEESVGIINQTLIASDLKPISLLELHRESFFNVKQVEHSREKLIVNAFKEAQAKKPSIFQFLFRLLTSSKKQLLDTYRLEKTYELLRRRGVLDSKVTPQFLSDLGIYVESSTKGDDFKFGTGYRIEMNDTDANFYISASESGELLVDYKDMHKDIKRFGSLADITATTTFMAKYFDKALAEVRENALLKAKAFEHLSGCHRLFLNEPNN